LNKAQYGFHEILGETAKNGQLENFKTNALVKPAKTVSRSAVLVSLTGKSIRMVRLRIWNLLAIGRCLYFGMNFRPDPSAECLPRL
jgi:hypothetical protein